MTVAALYSEHVVDDRVQVGLAERVLDRHLGRELDQDRPAQMSPQEIAPLLLG